MTTQLERVARAMVAKGRGILAADESTGTIEKRFNSINVNNVEENRRAYREMLFTTKGLGQYISGVILFDAAAHVGHAASVDLHAAALVPVDRPQRKPSHAALLGVAQVIAKVVALLLGRAEHPAHQCAECPHCERPPSRVHHFPVMFGCAMTRAMAVATPLATVSQCANGAK